MAKPDTYAALSGNLFTLQRGVAESGVLAAGTHRLVLHLKDEPASNVLMATLPLLDRLVAEKSARLRTRQMEEMVEFMTQRLLAPAAGELEMAQRLAGRHARTLEEFGYFTAAQLAKANRSAAASKSALADNWRKRRQVFAVPHPDKSARTADVYPAFQFEDHRPIKAVQAVLRAFGERKSPWKLALWFTSGNGWLPGSARPAALLLSNPQAVIDAAQHDSAEPAA